MGNCVGGKGSKKDPTKLTEEEIKLLLDNTKLNRAQINALYHNFLKECPSGKLTKKDFVKLFKEVHPSENKKEKADKFCEYVFKVIDRDNLGYISFQDFVLCFSLTSYGDFKQKCEFAFRLYDLDKDGKISKKEMTQVLEALYDLSGITDRKGDRAPAKKVEEIIKKLNQAPAPAPAAEPAPVPEAAPAAASEAEPAAVAESAPTAEPAPAVDAPSKDKKAKPGKEKKSKPEKPAKEAKPKPAAKPAKLPDFITKEQFIEACNTDESIKKLFVDSIFASQSEAAIEVAEVIALGEASPNLIVETNTVIDSDQNQDVVTTTTKVLSDESAASTTVVNHSEVIISQHSVPEAAPHNSDEPAAAPAPAPAEVSLDPTAELNNQVNSVVEEINNTIQVEATSNETQSEAEPSSEKQSAAPEVAEAVPASEESNVEGKPVEGPK